VWVPKRGATEEHVGPATATAGDGRILHFWDPTGLELMLFRGPLNMTSDVWDVYLLYPAGVRWEGSTPPAPMYWMHQLEALSSSAIPRLDGAAFARQAHELLSRAP
jgi:hypothetical protein